MEPQIKRMDVEALDWGVLLGYVKGFARSLPAQARVLTWREESEWAKSVSEAQHLQVETSEALTLLHKEALWQGLRDLEDLEATFEILGKKGVLDAPKLKAIRDWLYCVETWSGFPKEDLKGTHFKHAVARLTDPSEPLRILNRVLTPTGEISEKASPKLYELSKSIRATEQQIHMRMDDLVKRYHADGVLQEKYSDFRDGRFVLPVKVSLQSKIDGTVLETSVSKQTAFVEPREVAELNIQLRNLRNAWAQELLTILQETSDHLREFLEEIRTGYEILVHWDATLARACAALHYGGSMIRVTENREFEIRLTAHPLLWWHLSSAQIIRNTVRMDPDTRVLLLSGPNTGGKTVLMKTLGLAVVFARTGFFIPAVEEARVPFFERLFVDLGDDQSIENKVSSFSGHVARYKQILEERTDRSLVLLDELNSATDPVEGAALARAIIEHLISEDGASPLIIATTHDPHLKSLGFSDKRIVNASMMFDEERNEPTYTMVLGLPGRSRALETARRLGIPSWLIDKAKGYLTAEHQGFEKLAERLEADLKKADHERRQAVELRLEAEKLKHEWSAKAEKSFTEILQPVRQKLKRLIADAQDEIRAQVRKLQESRSHQEADVIRRAMSEKLEGLEKQADHVIVETAPELAESLKIDDSKESAERQEPAQITKGSYVRVPKWKNLGQVLEISGADAKVGLLSKGVPSGIPVRVKITEMEALTEKDIAELAKTYPSIFGAMKDRKKVDIQAEDPGLPSESIDLRGLRFEDAMTQVEVYLDRAFRGGRREVTIIHGLGTGVLREGTLKLLRTLPYVKNFADGGPSRGGAGATVVEFG